MVWSWTARQKKFVKLGVPFFVLVIGGSFGLRSFSQVRYDYRGQKPVTPEEAEEMGVKMKRKGEVTLEKEFEKLKEMDIDTWENKRGPRPWEEDNPTNKEIMERASSRQRQ